MAGVGTGRQLHNLTRLIEDLLDISRISNANINLSGHKAVASEDGPSALKIARGFRPEVVILDIALPGMNGYDVAKSIRADVPTDILLVAISGYSQENDREKSRRSGFDHHLSEPIDLETVLAIIESHDFPPGRSVT